MLTTNKINQLMRRAQQAEGDPLADCEPLAMETLLELNALLSQRIEEETTRTIEREHLLLRQAHHAAMGEMVANITHQWRQPLNALSLILQNLRYDCLEGRMDCSGLNHYLDRAQQAVEQMTNTIDDFRLFFSGGAQVREFSLLATTRKCADLTSASLNAHQIALSIVGEDVRIIGVEREFLHAMLNLVVNAREALVERRIEHGRIEVEIGKRDSYAMVEVRDNAGGIDPALIERIFEPYFTTKPSGSGIGLHMSRVIIEQHMRGRLWAENGLQGACFHLQLPLESPPTERNG